MLSITMRSVTRIHLSNYLSTLVLRGLGDRRVLYFPLNSLFRVGLDGAIWDWSLTSRVYAVLSFWISGIKDMEIVEAILVQICLSALSF
jgi:hypothetical protein